MIVIQKNKRREWKEEEEEEKENSQGFKYVDSALRVFFPTHYRNHSARDYRQYYYSGIYMEYWKEEKKHDEDDIFL